MADYLNIAGRVRTTASDGVAMEAQEVKDLNLNKSQQEVNADVQTELGDRYTKEETYNREELNELITTPDVNRVYVIATNLTTAVTDLLPATGSSDTLYNVGNWDGTQYDTTVYSIYGWDGTAYVCLAVRSSIGEVYDISANHPDGQGNPTPYADLAAALGTDGANIPADIRRGGMSIKFIQGSVQSSDNKYVQFRLMAASWSTTVTDWQGVDDEPTIGSQNMVKSGGVYPALNIYDANYNTQPGTYFSLSSAIAAVPENFKRTGLLLAFREDADTPRVYMYNSGSISGFSNINNWKPILIGEINIENLSAQMKFALGFGNSTFSLWSPNTSYKVGDTVKGNRSIYFCITEHTSGESIDTTKFLSISIFEYLFRFGGIYWLNYNNIYAGGAPISFNGLTSSFLQGIKENRRYPNAALMVRDSNDIFHYYQYKKSLVSDSYWCDTENWFVLLESNLTIQDLEKQINDITYINDSAISPTTVGKVYNTGNYNIGDTLNDALSDNSAFNSWKIPVKKYDYIELKGRGGLYPRLWCITDTNKKVLSISPDNAIYSDITVINIGQDGYIYINARNDMQEYPYVVKHKSRLNLENILNEIAEFPTPSIYRPCKWLAMGDSIIEGWYSYKDETYPHGHGVFDQTKGWVYKMANITGKNVTNIGIGGTGYVDKGPSGTNMNARELIDTKTASDFSDFNLVTLAYGINDYKNGNITLGTMQDDVTIGGTVVSNMRYVIEKIQQFNPLIKIIVITPFNAAGYYGQELGDESTNYAIGYTKNGKTLQDYFEAFVEVCEYYGIQYIDATHTSLISRKAIPEQLPDGVHPSEDAHTMIAREMAERITIY